MRRYGSTPDFRLKTRLIPLLVALAAISTGCLYETNRVTPPPVAARTATLDELLAQLDRFGDVQTIRATVDLGLSFLNDDKDRLKTLKDVRGFVLAERPGKARIQAQYPVTHQKAFDMVSDEDEFSVYLVWRKRFIQGPTAITVHSDERSENIRPQHVVEPLLIEPPQGDETAAMDNLPRNGRLYHVVVFRKQEGDHEVITRKAWFDRSTLELGILEIYDGDGNIVTSATYQNWQTDNGAPYPGYVRISRPADGYNLEVQIKEPGINQPLAEDTFTLEPPAGIVIERVGDTEEPSAQASVE